MFNWRHLDELAEEIVRVAAILKANSKIIYKGLSIVFLLFVSATLASVIWTGRVGITENLLGVLFRSDKPFIVYEWNLLPPTSYPEFYVCRESVCTPDLDKRSQVLSVLTQLREEARATRAYFVVYRDNVRHIVAQSTSPGYVPLGQEMWVIGLNNPGYRQRLVQHYNGQCAEVDVDAVEHSTTSVYAEEYGTVSALSCPIANHSLKGYLGVDYGSILDNGEIDAQTQLIARHSIKIEQIMGYRNGEREHLE